MSALDGLLTRPGLAPGVRLAVAAMAAIGPADWSRLAECVRRSRERGCARSRLEETLLQAVLFFGFPRVVSAFEVLQREWPVDPAPSGGGLPPDAQPAAGRALFGSIYGDNAEAVAAMLRSFHGEFEAFVVEAAYGRILSRPGLAPAERELLAVAALAVLEQTPQLVAHGRGALALGAGEAQVHEALWTAWQDDARVGDAQRKILAKRS